MQVPPELNEQWKNHARNNPGRSYSSADISKLNRQFGYQKQYDDRQARQKRRDLELYQQNWEEISGSNTQAPEYMPQFGEKYYPGSDEYSGMSGNIQSNYNNKSKLFLERRARELKERQRKGIMTNSIGDTINTPPSRQNTFRPMNPMASSNKYDGYKSSKSMRPSAQMQNPFQF